MGGARRRSSVTRGMRRIFVPFRVASSRAVVWAMFLATMAMTTSAAFMAAATVGGSSSPCIFWAGMTMRQTFPPASWATPATTSPMENLSVSVRTRTSSPGWTPLRSTIVRAGRVRSILRILYPLLYKI